MPNIAAWGISGIDENTPGIIRAPKAAHGMNCKNFDNLAGIFSLYTTTKGKSLGI
ncbi:MAG: hypothetical protein PWQ37_610 [Candidatus Petromonas sp.]|nr:hypothetical protein [Candidatus Petromonas sp.]